MKSFQPFRLDEVNQCLWRENTRIALMPKPYAVLRHLVENAGRLVTHEELLNAVWPDTYVQPEVLRRYILEIRRVLGDQAEKPHFIETLPKRGYQFIAPVTDSESSSPPSQRFLNSWASADSDVPVLIQARKEYDQLKIKTRSL